MARQRADAFQHQPFRKQPVAFLGGLLDLGVRHLVIGALQPADEQRRLLPIVHQRKGDLRQHHAIGVAQQQGRFPFLIQRVDRRQFQRDRRAAFALRAGQHERLPAEMAEAHLQRHALDQQIVMIAQREQALDFVHVRRQIRAMQLARQVRLRAQDLVQQRIGGQGAEQAAGGAPVQQRTAEKLQAKRGFFPGVARRLIAINQRRHQLPAVERPGGYEWIAEL